MMSDPDDKVDETKLQLDSSFDISCVETKVLAPGKVFLVRNLLSESECDDLVEVVENSDCIETGVDYRVCLRTKFTSDVMAAEIWRRLEPVLRGQGVDKMVVEDRVLWRGDWEAVGCNEKIRLVKYGPGGKFEPHCDGYFERSTEERSFWTVNVYLNDVSEEAGGATRFLDNHEWMDDFKGGADEIKVRPAGGSALVFYQPNLLHEGEELLAGTKYLMRTDVMFRREGRWFQQLGQSQRQAVKLVKEAEALELAGEALQAWKIYSRAFKLWPELENGYHQE